MSGFSDVPLTVPEDAPLYHDTFEAKYVTNYLEEYAHNHIYNGKTMFSRIKFYCKAVKTNKVNDKWLVTTELPIYLKQKRPSQPPIVYTCRKLVVATGRTSHPKIPSIDWEPSMRFVRHQKAFGELSHQPLPWASGMLFFAVLGGGKSAADMVYELVKKGQNVKWIIRASGEGPALLFPAPGHGRYKNSVESSATRLKALFSPSPFMPNTWWSSMIRILLYGTRIGISYMIRRIRNVDQYCRNIAGYDSRPGSLSGFKFLDFSSS